MSDETWHVEDFSDHDNNGRYQESYEIWAGEGTYREALLNKTHRWIATCPTKEDADSIIAAHNNGSRERELAALRCRCPKTVHYSGGRVEWSRLTGHDTACPIHGTAALAAPPAPTGEQT